ncbi:hypothetical protein CBL_12024 [Carabus blaptoides fortunei]
MRTALTKSIKPRIDKLVNETQDQKNIAIVNTFRLYQIAHPNEDTTLLDIRRKIVLAYLCATKSIPIRPGPQKSNVVGGRVSSEVRLDRIYHLIVPIDTKRRCAACGKKTTRKCRRCDVPLQDKCFAEFHTE